MKKRKLHPEDVPKSDADETEKARGGVFDAEIVKKVSGRHVRIGANCSERTDEIPDEIHIFTSGSSQDHTVDPQSEKFFGIFFTADPAPHFTGDRNPGADLGNGGKIHHMACLGSIQVHQVDQRGFFLLPDHTLVCGRQLINGLLVVIAAEQPYTTAVSHINGREDLHNGAYP